MLNNYSDVMTVKEVADALGIGKNSAYRLIHERSLGCKHIGRKIIVPKTCLIDYLQSARYTVDQTADKSDCH